MRVRVGAGIDRGSGLDKMFIENATKDREKSVSCSLSVVSCWGGEESFGRWTAVRLCRENRDEPNARGSLTVVRTGNVQPRTASASGTGDRAGARGLRTGVPSEPRTEPCVVIALSRGPHSSGDRTAPSGAIQTVQLQDSPARARSAVAESVRSDSSLTLRVGIELRAPSRPGCRIARTTSRPARPTVVGRAGSETRAQQERTGGVGDPRPTTGDGRGRRPADKWDGRRSLALRDGAGGVGDPRATRSPSQSAHLA